MEQWPSAEQDKQRSAVDTHKTNSQSTAAFVNAIRLSFQCQHFAKLSK